MSDLELLKLMLKATEAKKMTWTQVAPDRYEADVDRFPYIIEYQSPCLCNGTASDVSLIRVFVGGVLITFADGTPQCEIVEEILAAAFSDWADHIRIMETERIEAANRLVALIDGK